MTVTNDGAAVPWLLAADVVIHNGCTTGLEAYLLERPVLCFQPITDPEFDLDLPNGVSEPAGSISELLALTAAILRDGSNEREDARKQALVRRHVEALDGPLACERILDAIERHLRLDPVPPPPRAERRAAIWRAWKRSITKRVNALFPSSKNATWYTQMRFGDLGAADLGSRIETFAALLGRFEGIRAEEIHPNIFRVTGR